MLKKSCRRAASVLNRKPVLWLFFIGAALFNEIALAQVGSVSDTIESTYWVVAYTVAGMGSVMVYGGALYAIHEALFNEDIPPKTLSWRFVESAFYYSGKLMLFAAVSGAGLMVIGFLNLLGFDLGTLVYLIFQPLFLIWPLMILSTQKVFRSLRPSLSVSVRLYLPLFALAVITFLLDTVLSIGADALYAFVNRLSADDIPDIHYIRILFCFPAGLWMCLRSGIVILLGDYEAERRLRA